MLPPSRSPNVPSFVDNRHPHRHSLPRLPSFDELTGNLCEYRSPDTNRSRKLESQPPSLRNPFASPAGSDHSASPQFPPTLLPVVHRRPLEQSESTPPVVALFPSPVALFPPPAPVRYDLRPTETQPPINLTATSHEHGRPSEVENWELDGDLTKIPLGWSYKEALDAVSFWACSSGLCLLLRIRALVVSSSIPHQHLISTTLLPPSPLHLPDNTPMTTE